LLPGNDMVLRDQRTATPGSPVEQLATIDDTGLATELPGRNLVAEGRPELPGNGQARIRQGDGVWRKVQLRTRVAVDRQDVAVVGTSRSGLAVMVELIQRPVGSRPGAGVIARDEQGKIEHLRGGLFRWRCNARTTHEEAHENREPEGSPATTERRRAGG